MMELKKHYTNEETGISYTLHGDFYLPDIKPAEENISLGKWGVMHKTYLEKHNRSLFNSLLVQGKLYQYCAEIENQASEMYDLLIEQIKKAEGVTEELKEQDQFEWVQRIGNIQQRAREIVCSELIYS
ncbi:MAG: TnpV protein [Ruminococcaceae bacterium]|nr:TnpV protein [Oscillospiraceae bacterium]